MNAQSITHVWKEYGGNGGVSIGNLEDQTMNMCVLRPREECRLSSAVLRCSTVRRVFDQPAPSAFDTDEYMLLSMWIGKDVISGSRSFNF